MLLLLLPSKATMNNAIECRQIRQNMSFSTGHMPANLTSTRVCVLCLTTKMLCCAFRCAAFQFLCKSIRPKLYVPASAHADDMIWHDVTLAHTGCQLPTHPILSLFLSLSLSLARQEQQRVPCETVISIIVGRNGRCPAVPQHIQDADVPDTLIVLNCCRCCCWCCCWPSVKLCCNRPWHATHDSYVHADMQPIHLNLYNDCC